VGGDAVGFEPGCHGLLLPLILLLFPLLIVRKECALASLFRPAFARLSAFIGVPPANQIAERIPTQNA
jgi:hypothetical protein